MKTFLKLFFLITVAISFGNCEKPGNNPEIGENLEFYLLDKYETINDLAEIDESTATIKENALIQYSDIILYNKTEHVFIVSSSVIKELSKGDYQAKALALTIDKKIIYTMYVWFAYSSASCNWTVIDPLGGGIFNGLYVKLGYPSEFEGARIQDKRNDSRILKLLEKDGKLIK